MDNNIVTQEAQGSDSAMPDASVPQSEWHSQIVGKKYENPFKPSIIDFLFALAVFVLGYLFARWVLFTNQGWGVTAFTTLYLLAATFYLVRKDAFKKSGAAIFWLVITWLTGASYSLWGNVGFQGIRSMFLFCSAVYYVIVATNSTLMGGTGNFLLIDGINTVIIIPFANFLNQYVSFKVLRRGSKRGKCLPVIVGIVIALILIAILIPLLERADAGGFGMLLGFFRYNFRFDLSGVLYVIAAIPVAAYMYGLVSGAAHKKGTDFITPEGAKKTVNALRILQPATINIVLGAVCVLYLVFIFSQLPYFFSAFTGAKPEGWLLHSEFARQGFFELCFIAAINLALLTASNLCSKRHRLDSKVMKMFNIALALITLVLIATAFSKMALYIDAFGLTMRRLLPCVFMIFLAIVFVALIALQKLNFSIVRFSLFVAAVIIVGLSLLNPDAMVVRYNADRYMSGTLREFDAEIAWRAGAAGVLPAIEVYNNTDNERLREELRWYFSMYSSLWGRSHRISLETYRAWRAASEGEFFPQRPGWEIIGD